MMENQELARLARVCRRQAHFASTPAVRSMLIELAREYEIGAEQLSAEALSEVTPE